MYTNLCTYCTIRVIVPDKTVGSCLDPELPRTGLGGGLDAGPGTPSLKEKSQLEPSRDGRAMTRDQEEPIREVMQEVIVNK
jgi:hypothetical protein